MLRNSLHVKKTWWWQWRLLFRTFLVVQTARNLPADAGDLGSIPGSGRSPGEGNGNPLRYSCLEKPIDRRVWWATVHWVPMSWTQMNHFQGGGINWEIGTDIHTLLYIKWKWSCSVMSDSLWPCGLCSWDIPGKSTGVGCHFLVQGIFLTQGSNPDLYIK